jgi:hypothetical protein
MPTIRRVATNDGAIPRMGLNIPVPAGTKPAARADQAGQRQTGRAEIMAAPPPKEGFTGIAMDGAIPRMVLSIPVPASTKPPPAPTSQKPPSGHKPGK